MNLKTNSMETTITLSKMDLLTEISRHLFGNKFNSLNDIEGIVRKNLGPIYRDFLKQLILDVLHTYHYDQTIWIEGSNSGDLYQDYLKFIVISIRESRNLDGDVENFLIYYILKENKLVN